MMRLGAFAALLAIACAAAQAETARDRAGREQFREASRICRYAPHAEQRACMARELCKNNRDPGACEERYFVNAERRDLVLDACRGRQGTALRDCMREEYKKLGPAPGS
jgi:hypothetical protein